MTEAILDFCLNHQGRVVKEDFQLFWAGERLEMVIAVYAATTDDGHRHAFVYRVD